MTISSQTRKAGPFTGNGTTVNFPFSFKCFSSADLRVVLTDSAGNETDLTLTSQYTVALNSDQNASAGGTVTTLTAYSSSYKVTIVGDVDYTQETDITNGGGFYPEVIESAFDKITMQIQQVNEKADRAVKVDVSSGVSPTDYLTTVEGYKTAAAASEAAALVSENNAAASEAAAAASAAAAATSYDNFDDRFLGPKSSAPTVDNDGNAIVTGALYFNTTSSDMYVRTAAGVWVTVNNLTASTNAHNSEVAAAASAAAALTSENNANTHKNDAYSSAFAAAVSETNADSSEASAASYASAASVSETNAAASKNTAITKAGEASSSASAAATSALNAANSESVASTKANEAAASASNASGSAVAAAASAVAADVSADAADVSEGNAAGSASAAAASASAASSSAAAAAASYDAFDDRFLGAKATPPSLDNDGNSLLEGAIFWNSSLKKLYIWDSSAWNQAAFDTSGAVSSFNTRTGAITLSSSDVTDALGFTPTKYSDAYPHFTGSMTIDGDLTVLGTTVTINTTNLAVEDNMIYLNEGSTTANPDLGIAGNYNDGTYRHAGMFRDATDGRWKFYHQYTLEPDASPYIDTSHASFTLADIQANRVYANLTGNVTGNADTVTDGVYTSNIGVTVQAYSANISNVLATQAEMEAGTESAIRTMSPLRVKQAIDARATALGFLKESNNLSDIGNAATARTNLGLAIGTDIPSKTGAGASGDWGINSTGIKNTGGWSIVPSGTKLYFNYNGTNVASLDSLGNFLALQNVTGFSGSV